MTHSYETTDIKQPRIMSYDDWAETFRPILNPLYDNAPFDGWMFETFGKELAYLRTCPRECIWTLLACDDEELYIVSGIHFVNRLGYFVTEVPIGEQDIEVLVD